MSDLEDFDEDTDCEGGEFLREKEMIARQKGNAGSVEYYDAQLAKDPDNPILQRLRARAANVPPLYPPPIAGIEQRPSSGKGLGIFCTTTMIRKGSFIAPYKGRVTCHENPDSQYQIEICDGKGVYVDASTRKYKKGNPAKFVNSITRWDGSETGGANVCYYTRYPQWPYVVLYAVRDIYPGQELLADYHWFDTVPKTNPCEPNCPSCF